VFLQTECGLNADGVQTLLQAVQIDQGLEDLLQRRYVTLAETIRGFKMIVNGECDHLPEQAFYMVGTIDEAFEKAKKI